MSCQDYTFEILNVYFKGNAYNTAVDNNPRYNEGGGNADAVITDQNIYYQLGQSIDNTQQEENKSRSNEDGANSETVADQNIYSQL